MKGTDRVRHCELCRLNVYNVSDMTRREAVDFIRGVEGRVCVTFLRRADGTVLTRNCPVGLAAVRKRVAAAAVALLAVISLGALAAVRWFRPSAPPAGTATTGSPTPGPPQQGAAVPADQHDETSPQNVEVKRERHMGALKTFKKDEDEN